PRSSPRRVEAASGWVLSRVGRKPYVLQPALLLGDVDRLAAVPGAELPHRRRQVVAHRALREEERGGGFGGGVVARGGGERLQLPRRQRAVALPDRRGRERRVDGRAAAGDGADRGGELRRRRVLEQEPVRTCGERPAQEAGTAERREDQRPCLGQL